MTAPRILLLGTCVYLFALALTAYFTRATTRRFFGALAGGLAVAVIGVGVEVLFQTLGFWHYPSAQQPYGPALMYPLVVLIFAVLALLGWRITRRFGARGQTVFLIAVAVIGTPRDYLVAGRALRFIVFKAGLLTVLVDAACWAGMTALALAVMRIFAGPAGADCLAHHFRRQQVQNGIEGEG